MRLSLSVNDRLIARASLNAKGWLGAHINWSEGFGGEPLNRVWLGSTDVSEEPNSVHSTWESVTLSVGDRVEIEVLADGESDAPVSVTRTSESPKNLFSDVEQARLLLEAVKICDGALRGVGDRARDVEPGAELHKIRHAVGVVLQAIDYQLITPTLQRHPELLAEAVGMGIR